MPANETLFNPGHLQPSNYGYRTKMKSRSVALSGTI